MLSTTVTDTGQITLPEEIRQHLKRVSGSRVEFVIDEEGQVKIFPLNVAVETLSGILHRPDMQRASLEDMETAISEGANDWASYQHPCSIPHQNRRQTSLDCFLNPRFSLQDFLHHQSNHRQTSQ